VCRGQSILPFCKNPEIDSGNFANPYDTKFDEEYFSVLELVCHDAALSVNGPVVDTISERGGPMGAHSSDIFSLGCVVLEIAACILMSSYYDAASARSAAASDQILCPMLSAS
jgi:hypothetical protein